MADLRSIVICIGSFLIQFVVFGISNNFGLVYYHIRREYHGTETETVLIGSIATGIIFIIDPLAEIFLSKVGITIYMIVSMVLCVISWLSSSFAHNQHILIFTYSVLWGTGAGLANHASLILIRKDFTKRLTLALNIITSGSGIGTLILGPFIEYVTDRHKLKWGCRMIAIFPLLFIVTIVATSCMRVDPDINVPPVTAATLQNDPSKKNFNPDHVGIGVGRRRFDLWYNRGVVMYTVGICVFMAGYYVPMFFLVEFATKQDIAAIDAQFIIGFLSIVSTISKIAFGILMDMQQIFGRTTVMVITLYTMSFGILIIPFSTEYWQFIFFSIIFGTGDGYICSQIYHVIGDLIPRKMKVEPVFQSLYSLISLAVITGPAIAGGLSSSSNSFKAPFYFGTVICLVGAIITTSIKIFEPKLEEPPW